MSSKTQVSLTLLLLTTALGYSVANQVRHFSTGPERAVMVELYTSEGCSSCPRAEAWLNRFKDDPRLWKRVFPMAFHVDYWDRLGWPDRFARKEWSARQRSYGRLWRARSIYTPGFAVNGQEWRGFFKGDKLPQQTPSKPGKLTLSTQNQNEWRIEFENDSPTRERVAHLALLGFGEATDVARGENRGRRLNHEFVVLSLQTGQLKSTDTILRLEAPRPKLKRYAVVAWISQPDLPVPLQVTGGWLGTP